MANERNLPLIGGGVVYWTIGPASSLEIIAEGFERLGLGRFTPSPRTPISALSQALSAYYGKPTTLIRPLAKKSDNGFAVVDEERGESGNVYSTRLTVKLDSDNQIVVADSNWYSQYPDELLVEAYRKAQRMLAATAVSNSLVAVLDHYGGTRLRPNGAIYWLPEYALGEWEQIGAIVESAVTQGESAVYLLRTILDDATIRAVRDAIVYEVTQAADGIRDEVAKGELGNAALEGRERKAKNLHYRVEQYESLLGETLETLHEIVRQAEEAAASAMAMQQHGDGGAFEAVFNVVG